MTEIKSTQEKYLKTIYKIAEKGEKTAKTTEIAKKLEISEPSVTEQIQKLQDQGLVCRAPYKGFTLSPIGKKEAEKITKKFEATKKFLSEILEVDKAEEQAEAIKHHITEETAEELERLNSDSTSL